HPAGAGAGVPGLPGRTLLIPAAPPSAALRCRRASGHLPVGAESQVAGQFERALQLLAGRGLEPQVRHAPVGQLDERLACGDVRMGRDLGAVPLHLEAADMPGFLAVLAVRLEWRFVGDVEAEGLASVLAQGTAEV